MAAKRKKSDMTLAQRNAEDLNKFRNEIRAEHLDQYEQLQRSDDIDTFRKQAYKDALRDAKASRS